MAIYDQYKEKDGKPKGQEAENLAEKNQPQALGRQSIHFKQPVYLIESASVVGTKEGKGPLGDLFDVVLTDEAVGTHELCHSLRVGRVGAECREHAAAVLLKIDVLVTHKGRI